MRIEWIDLDEVERGAFAVLTAFLHSRLASVDTINWALDLAPNERVKRAAILHLLDSAAAIVPDDPWVAGQRVRLNVDQGLQSIGLDEYKQQGAIESAIERYLVNQAQKNRVRDCIKNLELKESVNAICFNFILTSSPF